MVFLVLACLHVSYGPAQAAMVYHDINAANTVRVEDGETPPMTLNQSTFYNNDFLEVPAGGVNMTITGLAANARYGSVRIYARGEDWDRGPIYSYDGSVFTDAHDMVAAGGTTTDTSNGGLGNDANSNGMRMWIAVEDFSTDGDGSVSIWFGVPNPNPDSIRSNVDGIAFDDDPLEAPPAVTLDGGFGTGSVAANAAPGTRVGSLSMYNADPADFSYAIESTRGGDTNHFEIPDGTTNLLTKTWLDAASYTVDLIGVSNGVHVVTNRFVISVTAADVLFVVAAEVTSPLQDGDTVGALVSSADAWPGTTFTKVAGRTDLFHIAGSELQVTNRNDWGAVGSTHYVTVRATSGGKTRDVIIGAVIVPAAGTVLILR